MSNLNGFQGAVTGSSGSTGLLASQNGWYLYICPRGAHAAAAGSASPIVFDSTDSASRFSANDWVQVGTDTAKIRQISSVSGTSIAYSGSAMTVAQNDRIVRIGSTQPTVTGGSASYQPNTTIYQRDDSGGTPISNSLLTTDSLGGWKFYAADTLYDAIVQDSNRSIQGIIENINIGFGTILSNLIPANNGTQDIGDSSHYWDDIFYDGRLISGITDSATSISHRLMHNNLAYSTAGAKLVSFYNGLASEKAFIDKDGGMFLGSTLTVGGALGVTQPAVFGATATFNGAVGITGTLTLGGSLAGLTVSSGTAALIGSTLTVNGNMGVTGYALFGATATVNGALGVTGTAAFGATASFSGSVRFGNSVTVASSTTLTLPAGVFFNVTGTSVITSITGTSQTRLVVLYFPNGFTINDGGNLILGGNFTTGTSSTLTLISDGIANWVEVARSAN